jgi:phage-related protein
MKEIIWHGTSKTDLIRFPQEVKYEAGYQLDKVQHNREPSDWKPMVAIGQGVKEIRIQEANGQYRVIYVAKFVDGLHVLHAFQKKTQKTSKKDIDLAAKRYKEIGGYHD